MRFVLRRSYFIVIFFSVIVLFTPPQAFALVTFTDQTTGTSASGLRWLNITASSDGTKLAAYAYGSGTWTSTDSGMTWANTHGPGDFLTSSSDGTKLAGGSDGGDIWTSTDSGLTWTNRTTGTSASHLFWFSITSSSDGTKLAAFERSNNDIWTSTDSGLTWTNRTTGTSASGKHWFSITSSSDGTKLVAVEAPGDIWTSTDSGLTWTNRTTGTSASGKYWEDITSSSDGTKLAATDLTDYDIWTSTDSGLTWTNRTTGTSAEGNCCRFITSSSDGTKLVAEEQGGDIWTSTDSGLTWTNQTTGTSASGKFWEGITSSSDGTKLATPVEYGDIWTAILTAPALNTSAASSTTMTGATLNGSITATEGDNPETRGFVWGTGTSYGATTTESGRFSEGSYTAFLSSLTCNTTYHFASYATNIFGTGYGSDTTFTTSACPVAAPPPAESGAPVGSGPAAPSAAGILGYKAPRPQIDYPNGTIVYLDATSSTTTVPVNASTTTPSVPPTTLASSTEPQLAPVSTSPRSFVFGQNHQLHDQGSDILALQEFLNAHGFAVAASGSGSPGEETDFFGMKTYQALIKFQAANHLPATGYFGPLTRGILNQQ
jgi:putative peptidoglycan binding protein